MIRKILIANRGEIAVRIMRTCKAMNIAVVAVYSEADKEAAHVKLAEEGVMIGPPRAQDSYMNIDRIIEAAKETGADAIHPGYGFLSENSIFAERCEQEGIRFIGPAGEVIRMMGSKIEARRIMEAAGVPVVPGTKDAISTPDEALAFAGQFGYPVMLKASAGGGGIGMQAVYSDEELSKAFDSNSKRAMTFFGDGSMFLEKKIENARHVEVQILADSHGNAVHLFERECSIQRRNQKVIEEAPSSFISEQTRQKMGNAALMAVRSLEYTNAGTIEFLVDEEENFYFLEMNTRIQVEHPITEEITGLDIVEQQIRIASGETLGLSQEDIKVTGHSIEARIYAEDPVTFFPSPGRITKYRPPEATHIRNETAVQEGYQVTPFYDPMIAKLVVTGEDREQAIGRLQQALTSYEIEGIKTNIPMLEKIAGNEQFQAGNTTTAFVERYYLPIASK